MSRNDPHFRLRIPENLKREIEASAHANSRSITAEIVTRLETSLGMSGSHTTSLVAEIEHLRTRLAQLQRAIVEKDLDPT
ncbi:Arc family DNA-binding protein [Rhizobium cauense]|uniref:Arc family DNA-binding protein n=1 Tax=Rhizobium cauense TaxID=1166683 RepID=UPI001C6E89A6|nr:Arc family DNA-binding protein [Rhizobium cauense]MBW9113411.1 Arc family DNA-binding protein [Rhizobium cauense]